MEVDLKKSALIASAGIVEQEVETMIDKIVATASGNTLLARIATNISKRERDILWGYARQTDAYELAYTLDLEAQTVQNYLFAIQQKLNILSRTELLRQLFSAMLEKSKNSSAE